MDVIADRGVLADAARQCAALRHAVAVADWAGAGRPLTAKRVLRRADIPLAARALGIDVPERVRSAADVPTLHISWTAAVSLGWLAISGSRAMVGEAPADLRAATEDEVLAWWSQGLAAVLADMFEQDAAENLEYGRLALSVLDTDSPQAGDKLLYEILETIVESDLYQIGRLGIRPTELILGVMVAFGAVTDPGPQRPDTDSQWRITPLGRWALSAFGTSAMPPPRSGAEIAADAVCQLKITLKNVRPPCWRRFLVPASETLAGLHDIIQVAFDWDDDHLHGFEIGRRSYGDPYYGAEHDEGEMTTAAAFTQARQPISYVYDFGDSWRHEIVLEQTVEPDPAATYPVCVDGRGDAPVEDCPEDEQRWTPFDRADINATFAIWNDEAAQTDSRLEGDVEIILTDAYGAAEQMTAFLTVLEEEIDFPVPALLAGQPVVVTGLYEGRDTLRALYHRDITKSQAEFADLEFLPDTVAAWLHAVYRSHLGLRHAAVTPPPGWAGLGSWRS